MAVTSPPVPPSTSEPSSPSQGLRWQRLGRVAAVATIGIAVISVLGWRLTPDQADNSASDGGVVFDDVGSVRDVSTGDTVIHQATVPGGMVECDAISLANASPIPPRVNCPTGYFQATSDPDFDFRLTSHIEVIGENVLIEAEWEEWVEQLSGEWKVERSGIEELGPGKHEYLATDLPNDRFQRITIHPWPGAVVRLAEHGDGSGASATLTYIID